jgi:hypothetical protein
VYLRLSFTASRHALLVHDASSCCRAALSPSCLQQAVLGSEHPEISNYLTKLGVLCYRLAEFKESRAL